MEIANCSVSLRLSEKQSFIMAGISAIFHGSKFNETVKFQMRFCCIMNDYRYDLRELFFHDFVLWPEVQILLTKASGWTDYGTRRCIL